MPTLTDSRLLDLRDLRTRADHDEDLVREVCADFAAVAEGARRGLTSALEAADRRALARLAHRVKGAFATLGAAAGRQRASELESAAASAPMDAVAARTEALLETIDAIDDAVAAFLEGDGE